MISIHVSLASTSNGAHWRLEMIVSTHFIQLQPHTALFCRLEMENNLRAMAEADVSRIRGVRDALTLSTSDLELQIEGLKEEMVFMKNSHQEVSYIHFMCCGAI